MNGPREIIVFIDVIMVCGVYVAVAYANLLETKGFIVFCYAFHS